MRVFMPSCILCYLTVISPAVASSNSLWVSAGMHPKIGIPIILSYT